MTLRTIRFVPDGTRTDFVRHPLPASSATGLPSAAGQRLDPDIVLRRRIQIEIADEQPIGIRELGASPASSGLPMPLAFFVGVVGG